MLRKPVLFSRHRRLTVAVVGGIAFAMGAFMSLRHLPVPKVHDEFSYLLAADTFAHGRLTNPTHPMWEHFESFHIIHQPTYASKYPPTQGLFLALGQVTTGYPIAGIWLASGLAAAAVFWMLQGWVPGRWALLGSALVLCHPTIRLYWGQNYWGGDVALIGGSLLFGALPRIIKGVKPGDAVLLALGLLILANSRPYEGLVAVLPVAVVLLHWLMFKERTVAKQTLTQLFLPVGIILSLGAAGMAYYNARVTGSPGKMPYKVHEETYSIAPLFIWQSPRSEPEYRHKEMRDFWVGYSLRPFRHREYLSGLLKQMTKCPRKFLSFFVRPALIVPLLILPWCFRIRGTLFAVAVLAISFAASMATASFNPHYMAPVLPLFFLLLVQGMRCLCLCTFLGKPCGRFAVYGVVFAFLFVFLAKSAVYAYSARDPSTEWRVTGRTQILAELQRKPGRHLVIVRYGAEHSTFQEWVYNAADIDQARIVWARDMSGNKNARLLDYYRDRQTWLLLVDGSQPCLQPYPG